MHSFENYVFQQSFHFLKKCWSVFRTYEFRKVYFGFSLWKFNFLNSAKYIPSLKFPDVCKMLLIFDEDFMEFSWNDIVIAGNSRSLLELSESCRKASKF